MEIARAERFYDPLLRFMDYELVEKDENRLAWSVPSSAEDRRLQIPQFRRTPELRFHALLTEDGIWQVELVRA